MSLFLPRVLLLIHSVLLLWSLVGLAEWFAAEVPWSKVSNAAFPPWLLLAHWLVILGAASIFLVGYARRWRHTPQAMIGAYSAMALVCVIETFWFLSGTSRFVAMGLEYSAYITITALLHRLPAYVHHFHQSRSSG